MAQLHYDLVVVGAGPAGSSAARAAAERGLSVLLLDRRAEIGRPVQCAECVHPLILRWVPVPPDCIAFRTARLRTFLPGGQSLAMAAPAFILQRALFDQHLAALAVQAGADLWLQTTAVRPAPGGIIVRRGRGEEEVSATVIVGADGPRSTVGTWIGRRNSQLLAAAQVELVVASAAPETEVYFAPAYRGGYGWYFPKGLTANVGVGLGGPGATLAAAARALEHLLARLRAAGRISGAQTVARTAGFVPVGGLLQPWAGNVLLAGDAAGAVHPLTGAGILFAVISGQEAGAATAGAVRGDAAVFAAYERRCRALFGAAIERGLQARRRLAEGWTDDPAVLDRLLRENWIACEGYGHPQAAGEQGPAGGDEEVGVKGIV